MIRNIVIDGTGDLPEIPQERVDFFDGVLRDLRKANGTVAAGGRGVTVGDKIIAMSRLDMSELEWTVFVFGLGYKVGHSRGTDVSPAGGKRQ